MDLRLAQTLLTINLIGNTLIFLVASRIYLVPRLGHLHPRDVLLPVLLLHSTRHLGLMFLVPGVVHAGMPTGFAFPAAVGDLVSAMLALACVPLVIDGHPAARRMVQVFNVFGTVDLLSSITHANVPHAASHLGAAYWIPAFWVPALLVTHALVFVVTRKPWNEGAPASIQARSEPIDPSSPAFHGSAPADPSREQGAATPTGTGG